MPLIKRNVAEARRRQHISWKHQIKVILCASSAVFLLYLTQPKISKHFSDSDGVDAWWVRPKQTVKVLNAANANFPSLPEYTEELYSIDFHDDLEQDHLQPNSSGSSSSNSSAAAGVKASQVEGRTAIREDQLLKTNFRNNTSGGPNLSSQCKPLGSKFSLGWGGEVRRLPQLEALFTKYIFQYNDYIKYTHMATLAAQGNLLVAAWQASPGVKSDGLSKDMVVEGLNDQRLLYSVSSDTGVTWSRPLVFPTSGPGTAKWSPVLHLCPRTGRLWLFYSESVTCQVTTPSQRCNATSPRDGQGAKGARIRGGAGGNGTAAAGGIEGGGGGGRFSRKCESQHEGDEEEEEEDDNPQSGLIWAPGGDLMAMVLESAASLSTATAVAAQPAWSKPRRILAQNETGRNIPLVLANTPTVLSNGHWVLPYWEEVSQESIQRKGCQHQGQPVAGVLISQDDGENWQSHGAISDPDARLLEGTVVELRSGELLMLLRSNKGCLFETTSGDMGHTWSPPRPSRLPNPNSKVHLMRVQPSGHLLLAFNNHNHAGAYTPGCRACRTALQVAVSLDDGYSWQRLAEVDQEVAPGARLHYPTLLQVDNELAVVYSRFYLYKDPGQWSEAQGIRLVRFKLDKWIAAHQLVPFHTGAPSREALIHMVDHLLKTSPVENLKRLGVNRGRWKRLVTLLDSLYDITPWGGRAWLFSKSHFGTYAVARVWATLQASNILSQKEKSKLSLTIKSESGKNLTSIAIKPILITPKADKRK